MSATQMTSAIAKSVAYRAVSSVVMGECRGRLAAPPLPQPTPRGRREHGVCRTANSYRFRVTLKPHETVALPISERRELMETYDLANFGRPQLELFVRLNYLDDAARVTLEKIVALKDRIAATDAQLHLIDRETSEIGQDQQRLRDNIKALTTTTEARQLIARYIAKAGDQETRLEQLTKDKQAAGDKRMQLLEELENTIRSLTVNRLLTQRKEP